MGYYGAFYGFVLNEIFPDKKPKFQKYLQFLEHSKSFHMIYMFPEICFVSDFPLEIHVNKIHQLHKDKSHALLYRDGYGIKALNGVLVPDYVVDTDADKFTKEQILNEQNADFRREIIRKIGIEKTIELLGAKVIESKYDYDLLEISFGDKINRPYLKMVNPSIGTVHIEGVNPGCKTVLDAIKFRNSVNYLPKIIDAKMLPQDWPIGNYYAQGDALFFPIESIPFDAKKRSDFVAVKGLRRHIARGDSVQVFDGYVSTSEMCAIEHPEHETLFLEPGNYEVKQVLEYDHLLEESRKVID